MPKIINYLSRLDGVKVGEVHDSHSHYFYIGEAVVRVSDHLAITYNCPQTLNVVVETEHDVFVVFYGNKLIPVETYDKLRELLRNFVLVCDILAPLTDLRAATAKKMADKIVEERLRNIEPVPVSQPSIESNDWLWVGDLPEARRKGAQSMIDNMRKFAKKKKKK